MLKHVLRNTDRTECIMTNRFARLRTVVTHGSISYQKTDTGVNMALDVACDRRII